MQSNYDLIVELLGYAKCNEDFLIDYDKEIQNILDKMVLDQENIELYEKLFRKGWHKQIIVAIEEMSELQKELCKMLRNSNADNIEHIKEEIADVSIMLEQLIVLLKIKPSTIADIREMKLHRTRERLLQKEKINDK